jgi:phage-related protein
MTGEKPLYWVCSSKRDFLEFPASVTSDLGNALGLAQLGGKHPKANGVRSGGAFGSGCDMNNIFRSGR